MIIITFNNKNFPFFSSLIGLTSLSQAAPFTKMSIVSIISGAASKASGGDFVQGALSAMVVWLYNDLEKAIRYFNRGKLLPNSVGLGRALQRFFGGWSREYSFGPLHPVTQSLKHDPTLINAIKEYRKNFYLQNGRWPGKGDAARLKTGMFFPIGKGKANLDLQIIGSYSASIYFLSEKEYIVYIYNSMSWKSFLYHIIPDSWSKKLNSVELRFLFNGNIKDLK